MRPDPSAIDPAAHSPIVRRALRSLGVPAEALDDAVQDVFTVVVRREADFERDRSLTNWLWGIARGVASTHRRSLQRRARLHAALATTTGEVPDTEDALARAEATARIAAFVARLPVAMREVFVLAHLHGYSGPEIAERLGINLNTAYARIRSTRLRLEAELAPSEPVSIGARIMRAFAPLFAASSKSFATASLSASLVWIGTTLPGAPALPTVRAIDAAPVAVAEAARVPKAPPQPRMAPSPAKEGVMLEHTIASVALGAALVTTPAIATAAAPAKAPRAEAEPDDGDADDGARRGGTGNLTYYDFVEGDRLEGQILRPEGANVDSRTRVKFPSLISLRGHFLPELIRLAKDL